jgi:Arc/MetJ-type ribon-helix-helix transcriptional regulator
MARLTVTIDDDQSEFLDEISGDDGDYDSKSEAVRKFIEQGEEAHELQERIDELEDRLEAREDRIDTLEEQLQERHDIKNELQDLPDKIRGQESYTEQRQRKLDRAGLATRLKWKVTGVPVDDEQE